MRSLLALLALLLLTPPAAPQGVPNLVCRETQASLNRTGNLYSEIKWETNCRNGFDEVPPPRNNVLNTVCNEFSTKDLSGENVRYEATDTRYHWSSSSIATKPLPDGTPTTTTQSWTVTLNPLTATFTAVNEMRFDGGRHHSLEVAQSSGICEALRP